jgi:predicted nucleic acid-binding protein
VRRKKLLDTYALLAYLKKEDKYEKVKNLLSSTHVVLLMNEINIGETFYILARERGIEKADYFINTILPNLPITHEVNTFQDVLEAARIKAHYPLSYADCFAIQTAVKEEASLVTGDPDFKKVEKLIEIDWL